MQFKGQLLLPDDTGPGLRVNLDVAAHHLAVESDGGGLGAWPLETVSVERRGDTFALTVAGEPLQFVADDTIAFAYSGVPAIERVSGRPRVRSGFRSFFVRIWNGPEETGPHSESQIASDAIPETETRPEPEVEEVAVSSPPDRTAEAMAVISEALRDFEEMVDSVDEEIPPLTTAETPATGAVDSPGCPAVGADGRRCESPILTSSGHCHLHDPKRVFEVDYRAAQEARAQLKRDATERLNRIYDRLDRAMHQVEKGELDPGTASAMAQIANTMCAILGMEAPSDDQPD